MRVRPSARGIWALSWCLVTVPLFVPLAVSDAQPTTSPETYLERGIALYKKGNCPDAVQAFRKAISLIPRYARAYSWLGLCYERLGRIQDALSAFRKVVELDPKSDDARLAEQWIRRLEASAPRPSPRPERTVAGAPATPVPTPVAVQLMPSPPFQPTPAPPPPTPSQVPAPTVIPAETLILPGVGIGRLRLGMTEEQAIRVMGPIAARFDTPVPQVWWAASGPSVPVAPWGSEIGAFLHGGRVGSVQLWGATGFRTASGLAIGMPVQPFLTEFGRESRESERSNNYRMLAFDQHGVSIYVDGQTVVGIAVQPRWSSNGHPWQLGASVIPGREIGGVRPGMTLEEVRGVLGGDDHVYTARCGNESCPAFQWWLLGARFKGFENEMPRLIVFTSAATGRTIDIQLTAEGVQTPRGNQVGMPVEAFLQELGEPSRTGTWTWSDRATTMDFNRAGFGLAFARLSTGTRQVVMIRVFPPR